MKLHLANMITGFRAMLIPFIYETLLTVYRPVCLLLYFIALFSDVLDGHVARQTGSASKEGAFFDAGVDFLLAFSGILGCAVLGLLNVWVLGVLVLVFLQFIIGLRSQKSVYDPIGKLFGIFSLLIVPITLMFPNMPIIYVELAIFVLGGFSILGRRLYLSNQARGQHPKREWNPIRGHMLSTSRPGFGYQESI